MLLGSKFTAKRLSRHLLYRSSCHDTIIFKPRFYNISKTIQFFGPMFLVNTYSERYGGLVGGVVGTGRDGKLRGWRKWTFCPLSNITDTAECPFCSVSTVGLAGCSGKCRISIRWSCHAQGHDKSYNMEIGNRHLVYFRGRRNDYCI